jgi:hypothetical protein
MAYDPLTPADLVAGKPTKEEIFTTVRANQEQFNSDIQSLQGTSKVDIFNLKFAGKINQYSSAELATFVPVFKAPIGATIVSFVVTLLSVSTSGTLEVEIDKSTDNGANWTPLLSSSVDLTGTTVGSTSGAVNWVDVPSQSYAQNDLLRIRFTGVQVDQGEFHVSIYGEL